MSKTKEVEAKQLKEPEFKEFYLAASYYNGCDPYVFAHTEKKAAERAVKEKSADAIFVVKIPYQLPKKEPQSETSESKKQD